MEPHFPEEKHEQTLDALRMAWKERDYYWMSYIMNRTEKWMVELKLKEADTEKKTSIPNNSNPSPLQSRSRDVTWEQYIGRVWIKLEKADSQVKLQFWKQMHEMAINIQRELDNKSKSESTSESTGMSCIVS
jgi:hypothetical protein